MVSFADRTDAGQRLADALLARDVTADVVLAVPRGGLPVGSAVAERLGVPLDVVIARKVGAPGNAELALGAVGADGTRWLNDALVRERDVSEGYVESAVERERAAAAQKRDRYRSDRPPLELDGKAVLVVDDGVATGATALACLRQVRAASASRLVLAVPVAASEALARLHREADDVVCVATPAEFGAVGRFYRSFGQVSDEEARGYLTG